LIAGKDPHGGPFLFALFAKNADAEEETVFLGSKKNTGSLYSVSACVANTVKRNAHPVEAIPAINLPDTSGHGPAGKREGG
jgi:hypothetical protein